jgi:hypothetical protein
MTFAIAAFAILICAGVVTDLAFKINRYTQDRIARRKRQRAYARLVETDADRAARQAHLIRIARRVKAEREGGPTTVPKVERSKGNGQAENI